MVSAVIQGECKTNVIIGAASIDNLATLIPVNRQLFFCVVTLTIHLHCLTTLITM